MSICFLNQKEKLSKSSDYGSENTRKRKFDKLFSPIEGLGLLKEYLRELPEPVFSNCLYQMLVDAMGVFLPDDPDGNAKLVFSILDCLPKANRVSN